MTWQRFMTAVACFCGAMASPTLSRAQEADQRGAMASPMLSSEQQADSPAAELSGPGGTVKAKPLPVKLTAAVGYYMLATVDEDPENDQSLSWSVGARAKVLPDLTIFANAGVTERFTVEKDESAFRARDTRVGARHSTELELGPLEANLENTVTLYLPTSRASLNQDLFIAPQIASSLSIEPVDNLTLSIGPRFRYRFHKYAERAGKAGIMNTQYEISGNIGADYRILKDRTWGKLSAGVSTMSTWIRRFNSRDDHSSASSDRAVWLQRYGWEAHVGYTPIKVATLSLAVDQTGSVLRDGVVNTFVAHRDETMLIFRLSGRY